MFETLTYTELAKKGLAKPRPDPVASNVDDEKLHAVLRAATARIRVIGAGGSGNNTLNRMAEVGLDGAQLIGLNTDAQHLLITNSDKKILIGEKTTKGLGAGADPSVGEAAAMESEADIKNALEGADMVFVACGLGGGTGTGSAPMIAKIANELGILTLGVVTLPFSVEGKKRTENAVQGLEKLKKYTDTVIAIPNDKLLQIVPDLPLNSAFKIADELLTKAVKGITDLILKPGLVNLDFADVRTILRKSGAAMIGVGEGVSETGGEERAYESVENALSSPLLDLDISNAKRALINVTGGPDMTLQEAKLIVETVGERIDNDANIIWGAGINENMARNALHTMVVIAGAQLTAKDSAKTVTEDLEIDFI